MNIDVIKFFTVAVGFMMREGWTEEDARAELNNALNKISLSDLTGTSWEPYALTSRKGLTRRLHRRDRIALQQLFQNAANHSFYQDAHKKTARYLSVAGCFFMC